MHSYQKATGDIPKHQTERQKVKFEAELAELDNIIRSGCRMPQKYLLKIIRSKDPEVQTERKACNYAPDKIKAFQLKFAQALKDTLISKVSHTEEVEDLER